MPEEWLDADIKQGIGESEVESRRKRFGWNELTSEKENLFIKFLMFFTGPILYGESPSAPEADPRLPSRVLRPQWLDTAITIAFCKLFRPAWSYGRNGLACASEL